jgi:tetratricopeptide (TPR) repeat protein
MKSIFSAILICLAVSACAFAADDRQIFDFASSLHASGNYYGAVLEYQRLISYFPASKLSEEASYMIGMSYLKAGRADDASAAFKAFISSYPKSGRSAGALTGISSAYYSIKNYSKGISEIYSLKEARFQSDPLMSCSSDYLIGWGYLGKHDFNAARSSFYYLSTLESSYKEEASSLAEDSRLGLSLPSKSPFLAGTLSALLPGSGQAYAERYYDGFVSFFLNAAFIYLATDAYRTGNDASGLFFSVIELGWYSGNIYGAVRGANKYNDEKADEYVNGLKVKYGLEF